MPFITLVEADASLITPSNLGNPLTSVGQTLADLRAELFLQLGARADVTPERMNLWLNFSYRELATNLEIDALKGSLTFDLEVGQSLYLLPAEVRATRNISVVDTVTYGDRGGIILEKSDLAEYRKRGNLSAEPKSYFRERNILVFWPTPKNIRTVSLDIWISPANLVLDTDSSILGLDFDETILKNARQKGYSALQDFEKSTVAQNDFVENIRQKEDREEREDDSRVILSSVPRRKSQLRRQPSHWQGDRHDLP